MKISENWSRMWQKIPSFLKNEYVIVSAVFVVVILFVGQQSIIRDIQRGQQIRKAKAELKQINQEVECAKNELELLSQTDSLERFAREKYYMHADNEDVYVVK